MYVVLCAVLNTTSISVSATIQNYILSCLMQYYFLAYVKINIFKSRGRKTETFNFRFFLIANFFIKLSRVLY